MENWSGYIIWNRIVVKKKSTTRDKEKYAIVIKVENYHTHITILNTYASKIEFQHTCSKFGKTKGKSRENHSHIWRF